MPHTPYTKQHAADREAEQDSEDTIARSLRHGGVALEHELDDVGHGHEHHSDAERAIEGLTAMKCHVGLHSMNREGRCMD